METTAQQPKRVTPFRRAQTRRAMTGLPLRPRFLREVVVAPCNDGIVADGTGRLVVLQGNATKALIPDLIRLMDGTRTIDDLYSALDTVPEQDVRAAISVLTNSGLVAESGETVDEIARVNRDSRSFFERFIGVANHARNGIEAYARLQSSNIVLMAAGASTETTRRLAHLLTATGAGSVTCFASESPAQLESKLAKLPANSLVVVLSLTPENRRLGLLVDSSCRQFHLSWLRAGLDESGAFFDIGPLFGGTRSACFSCFLSAHSDSPQLPAPPPMTTLEAEFWLDFVATEIVLLQARIGDCLAPSHFRRYSLAADRSQALTVFRMPGCPRCRPVPGLIEKVTDTSRVPTALVFEDYVGVQQRPVFNSAKEEARLGPEALRELMRPAKELPHSEHIQLTRSLPNLEYSVLNLLRGQCPQSHSLVAEELGQALMLGAGIRRFGRSSGIVKRWAATSGSLGSVEAFAVVNHVNGLHPGVYFYQAGDHSLARLDNDSSSVAGFITAATGLVSDTPDALIILTGAYHRVSQKYGPFAFRLINLDAGVAASQLGLVASALGMTSRQLGAWDDHLIEKRLNLEPFQEQVTTVLALYSARDNACPSSQNTSSPFCCDDGGAGSLRRFCGEPVPVVTETLYRESRLRRKSAPDTVRSSTSPLKNYADAPFAATFPGILEGGRTLAEVLSHRASIRHYTNDPVSLTQLAGILTSACDGDRRDWPQDHQLMPLEFLVLASRVEGVVPGAYLYDRSENALRHWRSDYSPDQQGELFLQEEFAYSPLTVWIFGNLAAACEKHGSFGHRQLLLRAGAAAHRCWMAALSLGMQGCPVAGMIPGAARDLLGLDGYTKASLLAFAGGHTSFEQLRQPRAGAPDMPWV
jgi:SagB-type dehydrogenase family enzyme